MLQRVDLLIMSSKHAPQSSAVAIASRNKALTSGCSMKYVTYRLSQNASQVVSKMYSVETVKAIIVAAIILLRYVPFKQVRCQREHTMRTYIKVIKHVIYTLKREIYNWHISIIVLHNYARSIFYYHFSHYNFRNMVFVNMQLLTIYYLYM